MDLYLITGFLGAGKTTFLKNFVNVFSDKKMALIINEFGKEGVDGILLSELEITMAQINNGSIFCSCRLDKFEEELGKITALSPEVIIIEASGLSDPTNIKKILLSNKNYSDINYKGSICLVDLVNFKKVINTAVVCRKQLSVSDLAVLNKSDLVDASGINEVKSAILDQHPNMHFHATSFGEIDEDLLQLIKSLSANAEVEAAHSGADITLKKYLVTINEKFSAYSLQKFLEMVILETYRIKGFVKLNDGEYYLVDCVQNIASVKKLDKKPQTDTVQKIVFLAGKGMKTNTALKNAREWYKDCIDGIE